MKWLSTVRHLLSIPLMILVPLLMLALAVNSLVWLFCTVTGRVDTQAYHYAVDVLETNGLRTVVAALLLALLRWGPGGCWSRLKDLAASMNKNPS